MKHIKGRLGSLAMIGLWGLMFALFCAPHDTWCAEKQKPKAPPQELNVMKSNSPLHIASDRMEVSQTDKTIFFEGHVVVQQDDMTITGNRMKVFAASSSKSTPSVSGKAQQSSMMDQVDRIEIEGDVKISQKDKVATSDKSVYYHQQKKIVLIGNPSVSQGKDSVRGRVITLYLAEGRSVVEGGDAPVQAVLHPSRKD